MDDLLDRVLQAISYCASPGPRRTAINGQLHCATSPQIAHDFVLIRDDGYTLGVRVEWLEKARAMQFLGIRHRWVALVKKDESLGGYHRVW